MGFCCTIKNNFINMKKIIILYWLPVIVLFFTSCEGEFINNPGTNSVVVNGFFSSQDTFRINISMSKPAGEPATTQFLETAQVTLTLPDGLAIPVPFDSMTEYVGTKTEGFYSIAGLLPDLPGVYSLEVELQDHAKITAADSIPAPVQITGLNYFGDSASRLLQFNLSFDDPPDADNYYAISMDEYYYHENDSILSENEEIYSYNSKVEAQIWGPLSQIIFSDKTFTETGQSIDFYLGYFPFSNSWDSCMVKIKLLSVSKAYYDYAISFNEQSIAEEDFYAEPVNVFNNIQGGFGIFAGYSYRSADLVYIKGQTYVRINE